MKIISKLLLTSLLNVLWIMIGCAAPLLDTKDTWNENIFAPVKAACSPDGQCWGWLPIPENYDVIMSEQESDTSSKPQRQIANPVSEFTSRSEDNMLEETGREIRSPFFNKQTPSRNAKKNVFIPRDWAASGMPFSVLYLNSRLNPRLNHAVTTTSTSQRQELSSTTESSTPSAKHSNSRITPRNGLSVIPSRRHWTIPQFFTSYNWGSFGK